MKVLASLFFIGLFPIVIFLASILYGGVTPQIIKAGLLKADIYNRLPQTLSELAKNSEENGDGETEIQPDTFFTPILARMNSSFLQEKAEKLIDDTDLWLRNDKISSPILSLSEIKADVLAANPDMLQMINETTNEMQSPEQNEEMKKMQEFIKNDFKIDLGKQLTPLRSSYKTLTIMFPVLLVLLLASYGAIIFLSQPTSSKLKWGGIVLILASVNGFIWVFFGAIITQLLTSFLLSLDNQIAKIASPFVLHTASFLVEKYKSYQIISSGALLVSGIILLVIKIVKGKVFAAPVKKGVTKKKK